MATLKRAVPMPADTTPTARGSRRATQKKPRTNKPRAPAGDTVTALLDPQRRRRLIAEAAYYRAELRGFAPGHEVEDWLSAESEIDIILTMGVTASGN